MVKVLPEPVTPSSTWSRSCARTPFTSSSIACGWSPSGSNSDDHPQRPPALRLFRPRRPVRRPRRPLADIGVALFEQLLRANSTVAAAPVMPRGWLSGAGLSNLAAAPRRSPTWARRARGSAAPPDARRAAASRGGTPWRATRPGCAAGFLRGGAWGEYGADREAREGQGGAVSGRSTRAGSRRAEAVRATFSIAYVSLADWTSGSLSRAIHQTFPSAVRDSAEFEAADGVRRPTRPFEL